MRHSKKGQHGLQDSCSGVSHQTCQKTALWLRKGHMGSVEENPSSREILDKEQTQKQDLRVEDTDDCAYDHGFQQEEL